MIDFSSRVGMDRGKHLLFGLAMVLSWFVASSLALGQTADNEPPPGFIALFNGNDFTGWKVPEGDGGHWKVVDGVIDYDAESEGKGDKCLWTQREFGDFVLNVDWRHLSPLPSLSAS